MKLDTEFIRLPLDFDVDRLQQEVGVFSESEWQPHPQGHPGNSALPLIAVGGDPANDDVSGPMAPTPHLERCEYLRQVLARFQTVLGRTRLMRLDGEAEATLHVDTNYYWAERVRIHVPIVTSPAIEFICDERSLHMPEGEAWIFDAWRKHNVLNPTGDRRIHLVADTVGTAAFWQLVERGGRPFAGNREPSAPIDRVPHEPGERPTLELEQRNFPVVMSPWEQHSLAKMVVDDLDPDGDDGGIRDVLAEFVRDWRALWARYGATEAGLPAYHKLLEAFGTWIDRLDGDVSLANGSNAAEIVRQWMIRPALNPKLAGRPRGSQPARRVSQTGPRFERPVFIVGPPRSGTTLLFETLSRSPSLWTIGGESHAVIEGIPELHPANRGWDSNRLGASDATPATVERLAAGFLAGLRDREDQPPADEATGLRLLEKTPKNSLRVPFLAAAYPDARFIYIYREPNESLSSMIAAWESGRFITYPELPDWPGPPWSLVLTPEWRKLRGKPLPEIVAGQWTMASRILIGDLERLPPERWSVVGYHALISDPQKEIERLCEFCEIEWDRELSGKLPLSRHTLTPPKPEKWMQHKPLLDAVLPGTAEVAERGRELLARPVSVSRRHKDVAPMLHSPYRGVASTNFSQILEQLGCSLMVSTYQTGKLVCVRRAEGGLNTHFRSLESPMGIAQQAGRLAVGTKSQIWEYQNLPQLCEKLQPPGLHDACFVPRHSHYTGDIRIHEVAYAADELWMVATRFSCLATLDPLHSFMPRWRPPFVTALAADDRCHLNGLAVVDDRVAYVTALGESDEPGGWREGKARGGCLIDVDSSEIVATGLSMPHSPRWHRDRLWLLESGEGTLAMVDPDSGDVETVAELPGFTRGLAFAGPVAFVGLSKVREATTFGGLPLTGRLEDRQCGVWAVNIESGDLIGFLRFEDLVEEIFDLTVVPGIAFPEVAEHGSDAVNLSFLVPEPAG